MKNHPTAFFYATIVALGGFIFGFDASVISGVVGFVSVEFELNPWQVGFVVSSPTLGALISSATAAPLSDAIGRRKVLIIIAALYVFSAIASAFAPSYEMLVLARMIGGIAFGSLILAPVYIAEISPPALRGKMISINQLNIVVGFSAAYFANYLFLQLSQSPGGWVSAFGVDEHTWRWMLGIEAIPALAYFLLLFLVPESPRWMILKGQIEKGKAVLERLIGSEEADREIEAIRKSAEGKPEPLLDRVKSLFGPKMRLALFVGIIVGFAQQITGVNAIYFYAPTIFEQSGVGTNAAFAQAIWVGIVNVIFTVLAMVLIDRLGRKPLMIVGLAGVFISLALCAYGFNRATYELTPEAMTQLESVEGVERLEPLVGNVYESDVAFKDEVRERLGETVFKTHEGTIIQSAITINSVMVLAGVLGFVAAFAFSLGPVMWVLLAEIFPNKLRGVAISFIGVLNAGTSFLVQLAFPWELMHLGTSITFMIYASFAALALGLVVGILPETKGKTLEEIEEQLAR